MSNTTKNLTAIDAFIAKTATFERLFEQLQRMRDEHFGVNPDAVTWGDVADMSYRLEQLQQLTDAYFKEGEFAA